MAAKRMRSDFRFKAWLIQKNNRERREAANPPSVVVPDNISSVDARATEITGGTIIS